MARNQASMVRRQRERQRQQKRREKQAKRDERREMKKEADPVDQENMIDWENAVRQTPIAILEEKEAAEGSEVEPEAEAATTSR